ncbi:MAG: PEP/pyruvate-binding domain-containing protein [Firmicutes bacterium]|nr:PEP/pyruvate-binding domain-containing protein [Bacillota bacterium]
MKLVYWIKELGQDDLNEVGKKCANLGEMTKKGLPVPPGFAISVEAYRRFMLETGINEEIQQIIRNGGDVIGRIDQLELMSRKIRSTIESLSMPDDIKEEILSYYHELSKQARKEHLKVAVRSSGAVSMPGSYETYLYVHGDYDIIEKVIKVWSSTFNARSINHRLEKKMNLLDTPIGVAVIKMVNASAAGVLFTINPLTSDRSKMLVEANYGLGESVVSGRVGPDRYKMNRITQTVEEKVLGAKEEECVYIPDKGGVVFQPVPENRRNGFCLSDQDLIQLLQLGKKVEAYFGGVPQDIEFAFDRDLQLKDNLFILQARPEQTHAANKKSRKPLTTSDGMNYISNFLSEGIKIGK